MMLDDLIKYGFLEVTDRAKIVLLREMYMTLLHKGHALHFTEEINGGQITKVSVYHYRSCAACNPNRGLPSTADLDKVAEENKIKERTQ
jgi:hypothetical protein